MIGHLQKKANEQRTLKEKYDSDEVAWSKVISDYAKTTKSFSQIVS